MEIDLWLRSDAPISAEAQKRRRAQCGEDALAGNQSKEKEEEEEVATNMLSTQQKGRLSLQSTQVHEDKGIHNSAPTPTPP
eukprot:2364381-Amphidinium_carterae.1